mgnify:CR=1 FL=1
MIMKKSIFIFALIAVSLTACKKAALKKPVEVNFRLDLDNKTNESADLKFVKGEINIGEFNVSGDRVEGDDIDFKRPFEGGLRVDLNGSGEVSELDYQIPQGDYTTLNVEFSAISDLTLPSLFVEGTYLPTSGAAKTIRFEHFSTLDFMLEGTSSEGLEFIVMDKKAGKKGDISFDPNYWFDTISAEQLDNADIIDQNGDNLILVNPTNNSQIYDIVVSRMTSGNSVIFE